MKSPHSRYRALFLLYRLFQTTKIFYSPDDAIATAAAQFCEEMRSGGGVVFNVKWRNYGDANTSTHGPSAKYICTS